MKPYYEDASVALYHGDCRDVLPTLNVSVDAILTDPPYAVSVERHNLNLAGVKARRGRNLDLLPEDRDWKAVAALWRDALDSALALAAPHCSVYAWVGHRLFGPTVAQLEAAGWMTRFLVWAKAVPPMGPPRSGWLSGAELCVYAYKHGRTWTHTVPCPNNVLVADSYRHGQPGKLPHPTQKPTRVVSPLVLASTHPGHLILDPFAGSGTMLRVAKDLGRRAIGVELREPYCELIAERMSQGALQLFGEDA